MVKEFKEFLLRGNLLDLAVAVVIGAAFTGVVNAFVNDLITPLIAAIVGKQQLRQPVLHRQRVAVRLRQLPQRPALLRPRGRW